jgi:predicted metal-binding membrane protein
MRVPVTDRRPFLASLVVLVGLAWLALVLWGASPYAWLLNHQALEAVRLSAPTAAALVLLVVVAGWTVMTVAMMLPTSLPLITLFAALTRQHRHPRWLVGLLLAGYLLVWSAFGILVHLADLGLHVAIATQAWLAERSGLIWAATLLVAGAYQFTPLKERCLAQCRSPLHFILSHWHGRQPRTEALWLGLHHGLYCLGCCWSLMLVMFAVGTGNLAWMLALGAVMAVEKNLPQGRRLSAPLGIVLLGAGTLVLLAQVLPRAGGNA